MRELGIFILIIVVLGIIGAAYYFLIYKNQTGSVTNSGTSTNTGYINTTGGFPVGTGTPITIPFKSGDDVYLNPNEPEVGIGISIQHLNGIPIYSYPNSSTSNFLVGITKHVWYDGKVIGKYVSNATSDFSKITLSGLQVYSYPTNLTSPQGHLTGDYFIKTSAIQRNPY